MLRTVPISGAGGAASGTATLSIAVTDGTNTVTPLSRLYFQGANVAGDGDSATVSIASSAAFFQTLIQSSSNLGVPTGTSYITFGSGTFTGNEGGRIAQIPRAAELSSLYISTGSTGVPATSSVVVTTRVDFADTSLALTLNAGTAPTATVTNTSATVTVSAGSRISMQFINSGPQSATIHSISMLLK